MELILRKNDFLQELQLFQGIVERKNTIPILANVLLEAQGEELKLLATDLDARAQHRPLPRNAVPGFAEHRGFGGHGLCIV